MGRIKTTFIKNLANSLLEEYGKEFTDNFEKNKEKLDELMKFESKKIRNILAGYLTRLIKKERSAYSNVNYRPIETKRKTRK